MRQTSFGTMTKFFFPTAMRSKCEVMTFLKTGRSHMHPDIEYAVCVQGSGYVHNGAEKVRVEEGDCVTIAPHTPHHMEPDLTEMLVMVILYGKSP